MGELTDPHVNANKLGILFPGQGSQYVGMNRDLLEQFPWSRELFEEASDATHTDLTKLCSEGPEADLQLTANAQPAILTTSYVWFEALRRNFDLVPTAGAGHSLGEYSALVAAGTLRFASAAELVRVRGSLMQQAVPAGKGAMAAVLGLDDTAIRKLCELATEGDHSLVVPANFNSPGQVVLAGHSGAVERAQEIAKGETHKDLKARKFVPLKVSAPFHCPLMTPVAQEFETNLKATIFSPREFAIAHCFDAEVRRAAEGDLVQLLRDQIDHPVLWTNCQKALQAEGISRYIEVGPGKTLSGLGKRIVEGAEFMVVESYATFQAFEKYWKENRK